jgi:hypothetical protein
MEIASAVSSTIDAKMPTCQNRSDLGEMAQMAAVETIMEVVGGRAHNLFGTSPEDVQRSFHELGTEKQFGAFAKSFFGRFISLRSQETDMAMTAPSARPGA